MRDLGEAFQAIRDAHGWSASRLARELGTSQPWMSMVLNGKRDPGVRRALTMLRRAGWDLVLVPSDTDPVRRRNFLIAAASVALSPGPNPYSSPAYVDGLAARLALHEAQLGGAPLAREAARHAARTIGTAGSGGPALAGAASRLCQQTALILNDVRAIDRAEDTARAALAFGQAAGDQIAQARAYDTLSLITASFRPARGMEYARLGLEVPGVPPADRAVLAARLGRAAALAREPRRARASLEHALELAGCPSAEVTGNVGIGFTDLGLPGRGSEHLAAAVRLSETSPFLYSLYVSRQAKAQIRAREPERAARDMMTLTMVAPLVQSPRLGFHLRHIYDGTAQWATIPVMKDARAALREVMA